MDRRDQAIAKTDKVARSIRRAGFKCDVEIIESGVIVWGKITVWLEGFVIAFVEVGDMNTITTADLVFRCGDKIDYYYFHEFGDVRCIRKIMEDVREIGTENILLDTGDEWRLSGK